MVKICPTCLYQNRGRASACGQCDGDLDQIECCAGCGATRFSFATYCYSCGVLLSDALFDAASERLQISGLDLAQDALEIEEDSPATTFLGKDVRLFHQASTTFLDLPLMLEVVVIGKSKGSFQPNIDLGNFSGAEFISRSHAQIYLRSRRYYIEDLDSKNGTEVNGLSLPSGRAQLLEFGDQTRLGGSDAFTFIFVKNQPINLDHLKMISGEDSAFEAELLASYISSVAVLLNALSAAIQSQDFTAIKEIGSQIAITSYNVGADVINLLGKQIIDQSVQQEAPACEKTLTLLQEGLDQVRVFSKVFHGL